MATEMCVPDDVVTARGPKGSRSINNMLNQTTIYHSVQFPANRQPAEQYLAGAAPNQCGLILISLFEAADQSVRTPCATNVPRGLFHLPPPWRRKSNNCSNNL